MQVASKVVKVKEKKQRSLFPLRGNLRLLVDDADVAGAEFAKALEFARENESWMFRKGPMRLERTCFVVSTSGGATSDAVSAKNNFVLEVGELGEDDVTAVYQTALGDFFAPFEVEVSMHVKRLVKASVVINRTAGAFSMQKNSNIINGLLRADKDCQDTEGELTSLWIHEVRRTYRDGLSGGGETETFDAVVARVLEEDVNPAAAARWREWGEGGAQRLYGDFVNIHGFYTEVESGAAMDYVRKAARRFNYAMRKEGRRGASDMVITRNKVELFCRMKRLLQMPNGHLVSQGGGKGE